MDRLILLDLADQAGRKVGLADAAFVEKMARRIRRKFGVPILREEIGAQATRFAEIFGAASAELRNHLRPSTDGIARLENVDDASLLAALVRKYPQEDAEILRSLAGWAIFYDYLH